MNYVNPTTYKNLKHKLNALASFDIPCLAKIRALAVIPHFFTGPTPSVGWDVICHKQSCVCSR